MIPVVSNKRLLPTIFAISDVVVQWCTQGDLLAVAGMEKQCQLVELGNGSLLKSALVKFYNVRGEHIYTLETPVQVGERLFKSVFNDFLAYFSYIVFLV